MAGEHVERREDCYYVVGTRISLDSIIYAFREGCSPESIREDFDGLTLANVYGAITFYLDHQADIDSYLLKSGVCNFPLRHGYTRSPFIATAIKIVN